MTIEEIPKAYRYICDGCGATHKQENANGHYSNSTPPDWSTVRLSHYDKQSSHEKLFCDECSKIVLRFITDWRGATPR